jgi:hypothetical protein
MLSHAARRVAFIIKEFRVKDFFLALGMALALAAPAIPVAAQQSTAVIKQGTELDAVLVQTLSSKTNHDGDKFTLLPKDGFWHKNPPQLKGSTIEGHLENVTPAGPTHRATMTVIIDDVKMADGRTLPLPVKLVSFTIFEPKTHNIRDAGIIIGAAVAGHMAAGKNHGGLAGAAAGVAIVSTLKSDITAKAGTVVKFKLTQNLDTAASGQ